MQIRRKFNCLTVVAVVLMVAAMPPKFVSAAKLSTILHAVLVPEDALHYEDLARQRGRYEEERYWRDYRAGLEEQRRDRGIGPDEARRYEELSRREHHMGEERYWRDYRAGFGRGRVYEPRRGD